MATQKMFTVDKFKGVSEATDGYSELGQGFASRISNWNITDAGNISVRSGFSPVPYFADGAAIVAVYSAFIRNDEYLIAVTYDGTDTISVHRKEGTIFTLAASRTGLLGIGSETEVVKIFPFGDKVYIQSAGTDVSISFGDQMQITVETPYVPTVVTGAAPTGGGTALDNLNLLSSKRKIRFSADGSATTYVLPEEATALVGAETDSGSIAATFDASSHSVKFASAPVKGVNNLTITYDTDPEAAASYRKKVTAMRFWEAYNGSTDTRLFFYGDGSNVALYTGVEDTGKASPLYVPAMNEICVDFSGSPITGMIRDHSSLMVYKPDGTSSIIYEPVTLADGSVIAGFYLRAVNRNVGSDCMGQVDLVNNYPRTIHAGALYEWRMPSSYYNDERYCKRISDPIAKSLAGANSAKIVTCDDNRSHTHYIFLGDDEGTILVHRYALDVWTVYHCPMAVDVRSAFCCEDTLVFATATQVFFLDETARYDNDGQTDHPITALWESGYMDFGEDYRRKFNTYLWLSIKPESYSCVTITAATDRKGTYAEKTIRSELFDYGKINYAKWSYDVSSAIRTRRIKLKVKKAIFYKLIIKVTEPGARGTVLGYDQLVRFTSLVK